jgi:RNA polymerase sigma factor (sigma-70 family)
MITLPNKSKTWRGKKVIFPFLDTQALIDRNKMVVDNMGLVGMVASRYWKEGHDIRDLIQEGTIGLVYAIRKYDPERAAFSTYAKFHIEASIKRYIRNNFSLIKIGSTKLQREAFSNRIEKREGDEEYNKAVEEIRRVSSIASLNVPYLADVNDELQNHIVSEDDSPEEVAIEQDIYEISK